MLAVGLDGTLYVDADLAIRNTSVIVDDALMIQRRFQPHGFAVETNQFQSLLADEMWRRANESGLHMPIFGFNNLVNKLVRIRSLTQYLAMGKMRFKGDSPGARLLVEQLRDFPLADHDDGPDALEMAIRTAAHLLSEPAYDEPDNLFVCERIIAV